MARYHRHRDTRGRFARRARRHARRSAKRSSGRRSSYRRAGRRNASRSGIVSSKGLLTLALLGGAGFLAYEALAKPAAAPPAKLPAPAPSTSAMVASAAPGIMQAFNAAFMSPTPMVEAPVSAAPGPAGQNYFAPGVSLQPAPAAAPIDNAPMTVFQPLTGGGNPMLMGLGSLFGGKRKVGALGKLVNISTGRQATHKGKPVHVDAAGNLYTMSGLGSYQLGSLGWAGRRDYKRVLEGLGKFSFKSMVQGALRVGAAPLIIGKTILQTGSVKKGLQAGRHEILTPARQVLANAQKPAPATPAGVPAGPSGSTYVGTDTNGDNVYQTASGQWVNSDGSPYTGVDAAYAPTPGPGVVGSAPFSAPAANPASPSSGLTYGGTDGAGMQFYYTATGQTVLANGQPYSPVQAPSAMSLPTSSPGSFAAPSAGGVGPTGLSFAGTDALGNAYYFNQYGQTVDENGAPYSPQLVEQGGFAPGLTFQFSDAAGNAIYTNQYGQYVDENGNPINPVSGPGQVATPYNMGMPVAAPYNYPSQSFNPSLSYGSAPGYANQANAYYPQQQNPNAPYLVTTGVQAGFWYNPGNDTYYNPQNGAYYDGYGRPMDANGNIVSAQSIWPQSQAQLDAVQAQDAAIDASFDATPSTAMDGLRGLGQLPPGWGGWEESVFDRTNNYPSDQAQADADLLPALCGLGLLPVQLANAVDNAAGGTKALRAPTMRTDIRAPRALFDGRVARVMAANGLTGLRGLGALAGGGRFLRPTY